jgi:DNA replication protein DnaC
MKNNIHFNIGHQPDELSVEEALICYTDMEDGFKFSINDIFFKPDEFKTFMNELSLKYGKPIKYDYSKTKNNVFHKYNSDKFRIYVRGNSTELVISIYTISEKINSEIWKIYLDNAVEEDDVELYMTSYYMNGNNLDESSKTIKLKELDYISNKYYPYIDSDLMFDQFFTGSENILLVVGEPGLGKSKLSTMALKHAFNNVSTLPYDKIVENPGLEYQYISVGYVKSIDVLSNDGFWRKITSIKHDFIIIDDLDYMLTKRDAELQTSEDTAKNAFLNQFLSFTDGVEKHKTKFIITTNQTYDDIDSALLRKGRLFDILELRRLDRAEGLSIWLENNLKESEFNEIFTTHEILPADIGSEIAKRLNTRISSNTLPYLRENGISKIEKASRKKTIGL